MSTAYIFAIATIGLKLITGYTGQFSLAHSGYMAVGAYTVGILTVDHGGSFWPAFALSIVTAAILGAWVAVLSLPLKGYSFGGTSIDPRIAIFEGGKIRELKLSTLKQRTKGRSSGPCGG